MSVSNFISALELVATVIDALCESGEYFAEFRSLVAQLETLQVALESVNCLEVDDAQQGGGRRIAQGAVQCQKTIDAFWEKIKKYQPSLKADGSGVRLRMDG
jgi:hypothetical protein